MPDDPFSTLGLPPSFEIEPAALQRAYLARSAAVHPDHADDPAAMDQSAAINRARQTLEDPESRADALLARLGGPSKEADRSLPPGFLPEIMDIRQQLEEAAGSGDAAATARLEDWAATRRAQSIADVRERFRGLGTPPDPAALKSIRTALNAWRYIERMLEQVRAGEE
jgi:DnaJ-domain-containing protein 1